MGTPRNFAAITSLDELAALCEKLLKDSLPIGFDVETGYTGPDRTRGSLYIDWDQQFVCGFSITNSDRWARYVPVAHDYGPNVDEREAWALVKPVLETLPVVAHNMKFEMRNLRALARKGRGPRIDINVHSDSQIESYVLGRYQRHGLKDLVKKVFDHDQPNIKTLFTTPDGKSITDNKVRMIRFNVLELRPDVINYACEDAVWTLALSKQHYDECRSKRSYIFDLELRTLPLLCDMEDAGHAVDWAALREQEAHAQPFEDYMTIAARKALEALAEVAGEFTDDEGQPVEVQTAGLYANLNLRSRKQVAKALYEDLGMSTTRVTKKGELSTDRIALEALSREHPAVKKMLEVREVGNLKARLKKWSNEYSIAHDGRVHANFNQTVVPSGRFSANDPSIQQLPKEWRWTVFPKVDAWNDEHWAQVLDKADFGRHYWTGNFRDFLIAGPEHYLLSFDFSQVELRVLAGMSREPALLEAFAADVDVHVATASKMLGVPIEQVTKKMRAIGKTMNFALLYGMGVRALADRLAISLDEAQRLYDLYFSSFSLVTKWMNEKKRFGMTNNFVVTHFGRKVPLWDLLSNNPKLWGRGERLCVNAPVQGTAADVMKVAMLKSQRRLIESGWWGERVWMINNLHDALTFEADNSVDPEELRQMLQPCVSFEIPEFPKFKVDWELGQRWGSSDAWAEEKAAFGEHWTVIYGDDDEDSVDQQVPPPKPVEDDTPTLLLDFPEGIEPERFRYFVQMCQQHPGLNRVIVTTPNGSKTMPFTTSLNERNTTTLQLVLGKVNVTERISA